MGTKRPPLTPGRRAELGLTGLGLGSGGVWLRKSLPFASGCRGSPRDQGPASAEPKEGDHPVRHPPNSGERVGPRGSPTFAKRD